MKYFIDKKSNEVYAYDQEQVDGGWVRKGLMPMTEAEVEAHLNPIPTTEQLAARVRTERDAALSVLDKFVSNPLRYSELSTKQKEEAVEYRQELLDVPQQESFPQSYVMPEVPTWL